MSDTDHGLTCQSLHELLDRQFYVFAKSMPKNPHYWTVDEANTKAGRPCHWESRGEFEAAVMAIREFGVAERYGRRDYICFHAGGFKWWSMGDPLPTTRLINRAITMPKNMLKPKFIS